MSVKLSLNDTILTSALEAYSNQDLVPNTTISPDGTEVTIAGNSWKKLALGDGYTITENTLLEFDFQSTAEGEIHAIGFDNNDNAFDGSQQQRFQLLGTQTQGRQNFRNYDTSQGWQSYQISVGDFFTGDFSYLTLVNDHDVANPNAESQFANIRLYEPEVAVTLAQTTIDADLTRYSAQDIDPHFSISPDKNEVTLTGNSWKKLALGDGYTITENTVLEFDFQSTAEGEIHAIGFDNDEILSGSAPNRFQLFGTERNSRQAFNNYDSSQGWQSYQISVGDFFTGDFSYLTLVNDHDVANPNAESQFANIRLYEAQVDVAVTLGDTTTDASLSGYGGQDIDPHFSISSDKNEVTLTGNSWKKLLLDGGYTITENTVLEFDFQSTAEGEIHAIGFDNNDNAFDGSQQQRFQLLGTQTQGRQNFRNYDTSQGWQSYQISVGDFFTGDFSYLTLVNDHDIANPNAESQFANIRLYEAQVDVAVTLGDTTTDASLSGYGGQDIDPVSSISADQTEVTLGGNSWKKLDLGGSYTITENTVLEFDFQSTAEGEIHAIGFDNNNNAFDGSQFQRFQLFGTQWQGLQNFRNYDTSQGWQSYQINVGDFFTGDFNYLTLVNDHDIANPNAESQFANIRLYEAIPVDNTPPTASLSADDLTEAGGGIHTFTVTYTDDVGIDFSSLDSSDLSVLGPNGLDAEATLLLVDEDSNGTPRTATYQIDAPDGSWGADDNGTYTVVLRSNQVSDTNGNTAVGTTLGNFAIDIEEEPPVEDIAAPTANFSGGNINSGGGSNYTFTVTYTDDVAVDVATLDSNDVQVTGANGFETTATLVGISENTNGTPRTATYQLSAPGSVWDANDNGTYTVSLQPDQVKDTSDKSVASGQIGSFNVNINDVNEVAQLGIFERSFSDTGSYSNPYAEVTATATLTNPSGQTQTIPLFWDGGDSWKLRYSPDEVGSWNWSISSNDGGLDGQSGSLDVVASTNRGSIQTDPDNPYHFEYQDGTPFYWFGDTNWRLGKTDASENLDRASVFDYIDQRADQGFNYIHANFGNGTVTGNAPNEGGSLWSGSLGNKINPGYFQEVDRRVEYANSKGITVGYMLDWAQGWDDYTAEERERYTEYVAARYSGYNVSFIVAGEFNETLNESIYRGLGETLAASDPHDRAIAVHPDGSAEVFANDPWATFGDYQQQYTNLHDSILGARDNNKPVVNSEYAYYLRDSNGDGRVDKPNSATLEDIRHASWDIVMAGGYFVTGWGTTYLGGKRDPGPFNTDDPRNDVWEEDVQYVREFFTRREWWELEPADNLISGSGGTQYALAEPGEHYVAYTRGSTNTQTLSLGDVPSATYRVQRFDPRTGTYTELADYTGNGSVTLTPPDGQDWIFVVSRQDAASSLIGTDAIDELVGDASDNTLVGNFGSDILTGGGGADTFVYNSHRDRADSITDFAGDDILQISASGFGGGLVAGVDLSDGTVSDTGVFVSGSTPVGTSANFLYEGGTLSFDLDGVGPQEAVEIATLEGSPALSSSQFSIIG